MNAKVFRRIFMLSFFTERLKAILLVLLFTVFVFAIPIEAQTVKKSAQKTPSESKPKKNFTYTRFQWNAQYYGFPMEFAIGLGHRKNDLVLFAPHIGVLMENKNYFRYTVFSGLSLGYKFFTWTARFHYEFWGVRKSKKPIYFGENNFGFAIPNGKISFLTFYGKKHWADVSSSTINYVVQNTLEQEIRLDGFLFDTGTWKGTAMLAANFSWVFQDQGKQSFSSYSLKGNIRVTYYHYFGELSFMPDFFYADSLDKSKANNANYCVAKTYNKITSREDFKTATNYYNFIFTQEVEYRFYVFRFWFPHNSFFVSAFANVGVGLKNQTRDLLYQAGGGIGYTIFDSVPFTLQFGFDQNKNFAFYTGVVARVSHN